MDKINKIHLSHGAGGEEMNELVNHITKKINIDSNWTTGNDSAYIKLGEEHYFFTSDSYTVNPIFFNGGDIGKIAFCGTVNDILMSGGVPIGLSLSFVIEEGFTKLDKILDSIKAESDKFKIPIVTGDTKVVEKGTLNGIIINTSAIGKGTPLNEKLVHGDSVIISRSIGNHGVALLSARYDFENNIETDSKQLFDEMNDVRELIKQSKDATRGGIGSVLNEISEKNNISIELDEELIPIDTKVSKMCDILGVNVYELANEGTMVVFCKKENEKIVLEKLQKYNSTASIMGRVTNYDSNNVIINTKIGKRILRTPTGNVVPRIC